MDFSGDRGWGPYVSGMGSPDGEEGEFFLGLDAMHRCVGFPCIYSGLCRRAIMRFFISMTSSARGGPFSARVDAAAAVAGFDGGSGGGRARYGRAFYRDFAVGGADTK